MTLLSARSFLSRSLIPAKLITERFLCNNNKCRMRKHFFQDSQIGIVSRKYSSNSFAEFEGALSDPVETRVLNLGEKLFISLHDLTGLPWWCIIASSALMLKISYLPCAILQRKIYDKYDLVEKQLDDIKMKVWHDVNEKQKFYHWSPVQSKRKFMWKMFKERRRLVVENNCSPMRALLLSFLEVPGWVFLSFTWKKLAGRDLSQMTTGGPIWCSNFTTPDPYYIIPVLVVVSRLCYVQLLKANQDMSNANTSKISQIIFHASRVFAFVIGWCSSLLPASVGFFWLFVPVFSFINVVFLTVPKVRRYFGLSWRNYTHRDLLRRFKNNILSILRLKKKEV